MSHTFLAEDGSLRVSEDRYTLDQVRQNVEPLERWYQRCMVTYNSEEGSEIPLYRTCDLLLILASFIFRQVG